MNYIEPKLYEQKQFINDITDATNALFSTCETLHKDENNNRVIKACIDDKNNKIYVLDLHNDIFSIFFHNFDEDEQPVIKDILEWQLKNLIKKPNSPFNLPLVFSNKSSDSIQINRDKFFIADLALEKFADVKKELAKIFGEDILSQKPTVNVSCADYIGTLKSYYDFLQSKNLISTTYDVDFFYKLNSETNEATNEYLETLKDQISVITNYCTNNGTLNTEYHKINMLDNRLIINLESGVYYVKIENPDNYTVYISKEYEDANEFIERIDSPSYNKDDELKEVILKVINGKTNYSYFPVVKDAFKIDIEVASEAVSKFIKNKNKP